MTNSPALSYETMIAAIEKENEIPGSWLTNILASNPHATRSVELVNALNNRSIPLDDYQVNLIIAASTNHYTPLQVAESMLSYYRFQEVEARANFANYISENSVTFDASEYINSLDEALAFGDLIQKANLMLETDNIINALDLMHNAPQQHKLSTREIEVLNDVQTIIRLEHDILTLQNGQLTEQQLQLLENYWLNDPYGAGPEALRVLISLIGYNPRFIDLNDDYSLRSTHVQKTEKPTQFNIFPNPATDYILFRRTGSELQKAQLRIYSIDGREVLSESIQPGQTEKSIWINDLQAGEYLITLQLGESDLLQRGTFIKL
jgi:hypothetical protein